MHRQATNIAARKEQGRHHVRVGCHHHTAGEGAKTGKVVALAQPFIIECRHEQFFDQLCGSTSAGAVAHVDATLFEIERAHDIFFDEIVHAISLKRP